MKLLYLVLNNAAQPKRWIEGTAPLGPVGGNALEVFLPLDQHDALGCAGHRLSPLPNALLLYSTCRATKRRRAIAKHPAEPPPHDCFGIADDSPDGFPAIRDVVNQALDHPGPQHALRIFRSFKTDRENAPVFLG